MYRNLRKYLEENAAQIVITRVDGDRRHGEGSCRWFAMVRERGEPRMTATASALSLDDALDELDAQFSPTGVAG
jgi:hypothetical protein